jgi:hypothetical protein
VMLGACAPGRRASENPLRALARRRKVSVRR